MANIYNGVKIINMEGSWLELEKIKDNIKFTLDTKKDKRFKNKEGKEIVIKADKDKLFTATMPYSLETIRAFEMYPDEILSDNLEVLEDSEYEGLLYTKLFINLKFNKELFEETDDINKDGEKIGTIINKIDKKKLRKLVYTSTVLIDGVEYCFFKRGGSKARTANVIFCKKQMKDSLYNPCLLGLEFIEDEEYDITSKEAYTSLIMSGIIGTINISKDEILIIDDIMSPSFPAIQTITTLDGQSDDEKIEVVNNMTDGQGLMDESIFNSNELLKDKTCALLRNDFTKCNALRTKLQEYYKKNKITKVYDMFKGEMDASKIKLVITPSSCKYLKFANQFKSERECYENWLSKIPNIFGIVKTNHKGNYSNSYPLSYQMINSMQLSKKEVKDLMKDELIYLKLLKDNTLITKNELKSFTPKRKKENRELRNEMGYFLNSLGTSDELSSGDMINSLLNINKDYRLTSDFKIYKKHQIQTYIDNLRLGKIRIKDSLYSIMISCPYTMLQATYKTLNETDFIMIGNECYCPYFKENEELMSIRNPQINAGNIGYMINKRHDEYKWFGYWENEKPIFDEVVFVNTYNYDIMNRLQGADFDIDTTYLSNNKLLVSKAKENQVWATPVNGIKGSKELRKYNDESLAELDSYLGQSTMNIGKIVNKSAIFNAYMYDGIINNKPEDYIKSCYKASSSLSSYSQIAIDMAKKSFIDENGKALSLNKLMNKLNKTTYKDKENNKKIILEYLFDMNNLQEVELYKIMNDKLSKERDNDYEIKYIPEIDITDKELEQYEKTKADYDNLSKEDKENSMIFDEYLKKVNTYVKKMKVPYFFTYTAQDNSYRIPTYMDCGMDYLEQILDEFDTKAMATDSIKICDLLESQRNLGEGNSNNEKIDGVRKIITNCNISLNKNYYSKKDSKEDSKRKSSLRKNAKRKAIKELQDKNLNTKTIHKILLRCFDLDINYNGKEIKMLDIDNNELSYIDKSTNKKITILAKELNELKSLTLTLIYNAYPNKFLECFIKNKLEKNEEIVRFWC